MSEYFIKDGYQIRQDLTAHVDPPMTEGNIWQPGVYKTALALTQMSSFGITQVVDLGCGSGGKLTWFDCDTVGIDLSPNIEIAQDLYPEREWHNMNLSDIDDGHEIIDLFSNRALVIAADVIEHMDDPLHLTDIVGDMIYEGAFGALISTPDRDLYHGEHSFGPPPNHGHVREWNMAEFWKFLDYEFGPANKVHCCYSQSVDHSNAKKTICAFVTKAERMNEVLPLLRSNHG